VRSWDSPDWSAPGGPKCFVQFSALISATRQVGATIGVAVLGTIIATVYQNRLHLPGLPAPAAATAHSSIAGGVAVATSAPPADVAHLLAAVRQAYTSGLDVMMWVCAGIAIAAAILAVIFVPRNAHSPGPAAIVSDSEPAALAGGATGAQ